MEKIIKEVCLSLLLCLGLTISALADEEVGDTYTCKPLGFSIAMPEPWCGKPYWKSTYYCEDYTTADDTRLQQAIGETSDKRLHMVSFSACGGEYPRVDIWVRFYQDDENQNKYDFSAFPDWCSAQAHDDTILKLIQPYMPIEINEQKAGYCKVQYKENMMSEQWVIPRDGYEIRIQVKSSRDSSEMTLKDIQWIIDSIRFWDDASVIRYKAPKRIKPAYGI